MVSLHSRLAAGLTAFSLLLGACAPEAWASAAAVRARVRTGPGVSAAPVSLRLGPAARLSLGTAPRLGTLSPALKAAPLKPSAVAAAAALLAPAAPAARALAPIEAAAPSASPASRERRMQIRAGTVRGSTARARPGVRAALARAARGLSPQAPAGELDARLDQVYDAFRAAPDDSAAATRGAAPASRRSLLARAAAVSALALAAVPSPALAADGAAQAAAAWFPGTESSAWIWLAAALPLAAFLIPALVKSFRNRRSRRARALAESLLAVPAGGGKSYDKYSRESATAGPGGERQLDRATLRLPAGRSLDQSYGRGAIELESIVMTPAAEGGWLVAKHAGLYSLRGKPRSGRVERFSVAQGESLDFGKALSARFLDASDSRLRALWSRWAPHESGKLRALLVGALAALPAFLMGAVVRDPAPLFMATAAGGLAAWAGLWLRARRIAGDATRGGWLALGAALAGVAALLPFGGLPGVLAAAAGALVGVILFREFHQPELGLDAGPAAPRPGAGTFAKVKYALIGLVFFVAAGGYLHPGSAGAEERAVIAAQMAATGELGREYAAYLRAHPEVPVSIVYSWQSRDMEGTLGMHTDAVPFVAPARVFLSADAYGLAPGDAQARELSLSTGLHELDHDKQERELGGVPTTIEHEYSAWDHQARFLLEQFRARPGLFEPGNHNHRKQEMLRRARIWLRDGPSAYREHVKLHYPKNPSVFTLEGKAAGSWQAYYRERELEHRQAWEARKGDARLLADLNAAIAKLDRAGAAQEPGPVRPWTGLIMGLLLTSLGWLLAVLGLDRALRRFYRKPG